MKTVVIMRIIIANRYGHSRLSTISKTDSDTDKIMICQILRYWVILLVSNIYAKQTCLRFQYNTFLIKAEEL